MTALLEIRFHSMREQNVGNRAIAFFKTWKRKAFRHGCIFSVQMPCAISWHCLKLPFTDGTNRFTASQNNITRQCSKFTCTDGSNRMMASEPCPTTQDHHVAVFRHCRRLLCIHGKQHMTALLQKNLYCSKTKRWHSSQNVLQSNTISQRFDTAANCQRVMAKNI